LALPLAEISKYAFVRTSSWMSFGGATMPTKPRKYSRAEAWTQYSDIKDLPHITVGEGILTLIHFWPRPPKNTSKIRNRLSGLIETAINNGHLRAEGEGVEAKVSPKDFFSWALSWRDHRASKPVPDPLHEAAERFGVPHQPISLCDALPLPRARMHIYEAVPSNLEEARDKCMEYQKQLFDARAEIERLKQENADFKTENEEFRRRLREKQKIGKEFGSLRFDKPSQKTE
jgi:hypothetical protein